jgi:Domain of unknown function (DUF4263)
MNTNDLLNDPRIKEPWPENWVNWTGPFSERLLDALERLIDTSQDERPIQAFLKEHPYVLATALYPHNCWIFPHPRLRGGLYIPDFLYCDRDSLGLRYRLVELESPTMRALNQDQSISRGTHHAVEQIQDYRGYLRASALAEQREFPDISERCEGLIIIGRGDDGRDEDGRRRLADLRQNDIEIASYDRLLAEARNHFNHREAGRKRTKEAAKKLTKALRKEQEHEVKVLRKKYERAVNKKSKKRKL